MKQIYGYIVLYAYTMLFKLAQFV